MKLPFDLVDRLEFQRRGRLGGLADCKSAIQQIANLRYAPGTPERSQARPEGIRRAVLGQVLTAGVFLWLGCGPVFSLEPVTLRSHSGQFIVRGLPLGAPLLGSAPRTEVSYVRLDPTLLAISCERIKSAVLAELAMKDLWRGRIYISLHPVQEDQEPIVVTSVHYSDGWSYQLEIPEQVDEVRLVSSLVEVLLRELANRNAPSIAAELPPWLAEGFAAHLRATLLSNFTLEPETRIARRERGQEPLARAREHLRGHAPLTFNELNWPAQEPLSGENLEIYQSCAQLFVYELLRLRDGRACLRDMLARLPEKLNWQTAFLGAFSAHFQRLIDVDKWWSLHAVRWVGEGFASVWENEQSCKQLDDILATSVQVRRASQELPLPTRVKLQDLLTEWDFPRQQPVLEQKLNLLQALRLRASRQTSSLVEDYRQTIDSYLQRRGHVGGSDRKNGASTNARLIVRDTLKHLDALDARRDALRQSTNPPPAQVTSGE